MIFCKGANFKEKKTLKVIALSAYFTNIEHVYDFGSGALLQSALTMTVVIWVVNNILVHPLYV